MTSEFKEFVASVPSPEGSFSPFAYYDHAGDCIEFFVENEMYYGQRLDALVTVYIGEKSGKVVGSLIKGVSQFLKEALQRNPGLWNDIETGHIRLEYLFTASMWKDMGTQAVTYKALRESAKGPLLTADIEPILGELMAMA